MKIKNWGKFQHFKDRRPPWVKLYRDLLDDMQWHELDPLSSKVLVTLWLLASEDEEQEGKLPDIKTLAWRMRMSEKQIKECLSKLSHWLVQDDINEISSKHQDDRPETETETETEQSESCDSLFGRFYESYPKKVGKPAALKAFKKCKPDGSLLQTMLDAIEQQSQSEQWQKNNGQYIPNPATWLNQERWNDGVDDKTISIFAGAI
jgi:transcriptional regulator of heat shock response